MTLDGFLSPSRPPRSGGDAQATTAPSHGWGSAPVASSGPRRRIAPAPIRTAVRALIVLLAFVIIHIAATALWAATVLAIVCMFIYRTLTSRRYPQ